MLVRKEKKEILSGSKRKKFCEVFKYKSADQRFQLDASVVLHGVDRPLEGCLSCLVRGSKMDLYIRHSSYICLAIGALIKAR